MQRDHFLKNLLFQAPEGLEWVSGHGIRLQAILLFILFDLICNMTTD